MVENRIRTQYVKELKKDFLNQLLHYGSYKTLIEEECANETELNFYASFYYRKEVKKPENL